MNKTKRCPACGEMLDVSEFYPRKDKKDGCSTRCKICHAKRCVVWRAKIKTTRRDPPKEKSCSRCGKTHPSNMFGHSNIVLSRLSSECKICRKIYRNQNHEKIRQKDREYYLKNKRRWRDYYLEHADHINKQRIENKNANRQRSWARTCLRNHRIKGLEISVLIDELHSMALDAIKCPICSIELNWNNSVTCVDSPTLDRINNDPEIRKDNIWIICHKCNTAKGAFPMNEFVEYCEMVVEKFGADFQSKEELAEEASEVRAIQDKEIPEAA